MFLDSATPPHKMLGASELPDSIVPATFERPRAILCDPSDVFIDSSSPMTLGNVNYFANTFSDSNTAYARPRALHNPTDIFTESTTGIIYPTLPT